MGLVFPFVEFLIITNQIICGEILWNEDLKGNDELNFWQKIFLNILNQSLLRLIFFHEYFMSLTQHLMYLVTI